MNVQVTRPLASRIKAPTYQRRCLQVRSQGKVVREFREDDNTLVDPNANAAESPSSPSEPINVSSMKVKFPGSKLSKEYKQKLRQEYVGWGGSEGQVLAAASSPSISLSSGRTSARSSELLASTWEHRAWTWGCFGLLAATVSEGLSQVTNVEEYAYVAGAVGIAYVLADLGTGIYHWGVDNYGDASTPVFGRQIAAFQGHHQKPWTITQREFCNNLHQVCKPATPIAAALLLGSFFWSSEWSCGTSFLLFLACMSQQFHAWSHMRGSELHPLVISLQDAGILVSRKMHGAHHKPPFSANYCIVSGMWNPLLDSTGAFRYLENLVLATTGVEPRSWHDVTPEWAEQIRT